MQHSENINELAMALSKAQGEMEAAKMDSKNPFFKSKYADLSSIWNAARPTLAKHNLCVMQSMEQSGDKTVLITTLAHSSGQWIKSWLPLSPGKPGMQELGSAITYARRYALSALIGVICDSEDDDGENAMNGIERKAPSKAALQTNAYAPKLQPVETTIHVDNTPKISKEQYDEMVQKAQKIDEMTKINVKSYIDKQGVKDWGLMPVPIWSVCMQIMDNNISMASKVAK